CRGPPSTRGCPAPSAPAVGGSRRSVANSSTAPVRPTTPGYLPAVAAVQPRSRRAELVVGVSTGPVWLRGLVSIGLGRRSWGRDRRRGGPNAHRANWEAGCASPASRAVRAGEPAGPVDSGAQPNAGEIGIDAS